MYNLPELIAERFESIVQSVHISHKYVDVSMVDSTLLLEVDILTKDMIEYSIPITYTTDQNALMVIGAVLESKSFDPEDLPKFWGEAATALVDDYLFGNEDASYFEINGKIIRISHLYNMGFVKSFYLNEDENAADKVYLDLENLMKVVGK